MARSHIQEEDSPYYPPRARWYSPVAYLGASLWRRLALDRLVIPDSMKFWELVASFFVPGLGIWFRGPKKWGLRALAAGPALVIIFVVFLGFRAANLAFGLLMALHAVSFVYYCNPLIAAGSFRARLVVTFLALLAIGLLFYLPARDHMLRHWLPLRFKGQVLVVRVSSQPGNIHRGDVVAYTLHKYDAGGAEEGGAVYLDGGIGIGPVLAVAGDTVAFSTNSFSVNGVVREDLPHMPQQGSVTLTKNQWFIWPDLGISGHGATREEVISGAMMTLAVVDKTQYHGQPYATWFGRKQHLP